MIKTLGNNIVNAFTGGSPVKAIYAYGEKVWPTSGPEPTEYYIKWTPSDISGIFTISGVNYRFEDYPSGYFSNYNGVITSNAFTNTSIERLETNARIIGVNAFLSCNSLSSVYVYSGTHISSSAFRYCGSLTTLYAECDYIGKYAFYNTSIKYITLPYCSQIGASAFGGDSHSYMYVHLRYPGVVSGAGAFGNYAIYEMKGPQWLNYEYKNDLLWYQCMHGYPDVFNYSGNHYVSYNGFYSIYSGGSIKSVELTNSSLITSITTDATGFSDNLRAPSTLEEVYLSQCTEVNHSVFKDCYSLHTVVIPNIRYIRTYAFENCSSLVSLNLSTCWVIGSSAFKGCINLQTIKVGSNCLLEGRNAFNNCPNLKSIYVPAGYINEYKSSSNWKYYSDKMVSYR